MKNLSYTFKKAVMRPGEPFRISMPSYEKDGYKWRLYPENGMPPYLVKETPVPDRPASTRMPQGRIFTCAAPEDEGECVFRVELWKEGVKKTAQSHQFKITVKK